VTFNKPRCALPGAPSLTTAAVAQTKPLNSMQKGPGGACRQSSAGTWQQKLRAAGPQAAPAAALASVHDVRDYAKRQAGNYFQSR
jgi:hypothetical protein